MGGKGGVPWYDPERWELKVGHDGDSPLSNHHHPPPPPPYWSKQQEEETMLQSGGIAAPVLGGRILVLIINYRGKKLRLSQGLGCLGWVGVESR